MRPAINLHDFRAMARRKLPQIAFDFIDGGADDELGMVRNREAFSDYQLLPRYLNDVTTRDQSTTLFGRKYSSPIGISPTGWPDCFAWVQTACSPQQPKKPMSRSCYQVPAISGLKTPQKLHPTTSGFRCMPQATIGSIWIWCAAHARPTSVSW